MFLENITLSNSSAVPLKLDFNGRSVSIGASFAFSIPGKQTSGNIYVAEYYNGRALRKVLAPSLFDSFGLTHRQTNVILENPSWITFSDNYFLAFMKPLSGSNNGKYFLIQNSPTNQAFVFGVEVPAVTLSPGESKNLHYHIMRAQKKKI